MTQWGLEALEVALLAELPNDMVNRPEAWSVLYDFQCAMVLFELRQIKVVHQSRGTAVTTPLGFGTVEAHGVVNAGSDFFSQAIAEYQQDFSVTGAHEVIERALHGSVLVRRDGFHGFGINHECCNDYHYRQS
jgi:hypothetical protein